MKKIAEVTSKIRPNLLFKGLGFLFDFVIVILILGLILNQGGVFIETANADTARVVKLSKEKEQSDTAHANSQVAEYSPQGLSPAGWTITDEYDQNVLTNLTDNNPATFSTISSNPTTGAAGFVINLGAATVVDRVYVTGPTTSEGQSTNDGNVASWGNPISTPPAGIVRVYVGNTPNPTTQVGESMIPYDAGNPVDAELDIRFQPVVGQYIRVELQTANIIWRNYSFWTTGSNLPTAATTLPWNVGEVEVHGFAGQNSITPKDAVVLPTNAAAAYETGITSSKYTYYLPLIQAAEDLSYYLGKLTGNPVPIITAAQESSYPGNIYVIEDLQPLAPNYSTMIANEQNGTLPGDISVVQTGNQIQFSGWPYRNVVKSVWTFLAEQGIHWVYPTPHGDYIPVKGSVDLSMLPLSASSISLGGKPTPKSVYANWNAPALLPLAPWINQTLLQGYLNIWRAGWNTTWNAVSVIGGAEIPSPPQTSTTLSSTLPDDYSTEFSGYPHNFSSVVPSDVLTYCNAGNCNSGSNPNTSWCGQNASGVSDCSTATAFNMTNPDLISWVANKMSAVAAYAPIDTSGTSGTSRIWYGLLPMDSTKWDQSSYSLQANSSSSSGVVPIPDPIPWVSGTGYSQSGAYYNFVNQVATQVKALDPANPPLVGALAYSDVFLPPPSWEVPSLSSNIKIEICQYGSMNLPISTATTSSSPNYAMKQVLDQWHALANASGALLGNYDYTLLLTDYWQQNPLLPVPAVAGIVDRADYLSSIGALEGGSQGSISSFPYNPWDFYAYARVRQNMSLTASQIEDEFFTSYFKEAATPMLAYYQTMENWQVQNNANMWDKGYADSIMAGTFPNQILYAMQGDLQQAQNLATSWIVQKRVADMIAGFNWIITQLNLASVSITNGGAGYKVGDIINLQDNGSPVSLSVSTIDPITSVTIASGGTGYAAGNWILINQAGAVGGYVVVSTVNSSGTITGLTFERAGSGYTTASAVPANGGSGSGATFNITVTPGMIASVSLDSIKYTTASGLAASGGSGSGAIFNITAPNLNDPTPYQAVGAEQNQAVSLGLQNGIVSLPYLNPNGNTAYIQPNSGPNQGGFCNGSTTGYGVTASLCPNALWSLGTGGAMVRLPLYFAQGGTYQITINANAGYGATTTNIPTLTVYLGPQNLGTISIPKTSSAVNYVLTANVPSGFGVQDFWVSGAGSAFITIYNVTISLPGYALSVSTAGNGYGEVFSSDNNINCGVNLNPVCSVSYNAGTEVTLTATPASGSVFTGWSGACSGTGTCTVAMSAAQNVTANFTSSPINGVCGSADQTYLYNMSSFGNNALCREGNPNPATVAFPAPGGLVKWTCVGLNNGFNSSCKAKRNPRTIVKLL